mmetsp:Transcript_2526/g.3908  ORF Transcript_2526/g.3908 Transcript_2526/m.3908 type:complete len:138 (-) Transcript_2526:99-512(-)
MLRLLPSLLFPCSRPSSFAPLLSSPSLLQSRSIYRKVERPDDPENGDLYEEMVDIMMHHESQHEPDHHVRFRRARYEKLKTLPYYKYKKFVKSIETDLINKRMARKQKKKGIKLLRLDPGISHHGDMLGIMRDDEAQ